MFTARCITTQKMATGAGLHCIGACLRLALMVLSSVGREAAVEDHNEQGAEEALREYIDRRDVRVGDKVALADDIEGICIEISHRDKRKWYKCAWWNRGQHCRDWFADVEVRRDD